MFVFKCGWFVRACADMCAACMCPVYPQEFCSIIYMSISIASHTNFSFIVAIFLHYSLGRSVYSALDLPSCTLPPTQLHPKPLFQLCRLSLSCISFKLYLGSFLCTPFSILQIIKQQISNHSLFLSNFLYLCALLWMRCTKKRLAKRM